MNTNALNILQLSPQVPFPLLDGGKVGIFNITKHLAQRGHNVTMLALDRTPGVDAKPLEEFCDLIRVRHSNRNSVPRALMNLFSEDPYNISKYDSPAYAEALSDLLARKTFDVVHVDHLHMARYGVSCRQQRQLPIVLREHNIESVIVERFAENARPALLQVWARMQARRIRDYEGRLAARYDMCCAVTQEDKKRLLKLAPTARVCVVPAGVDESLFVPEVAEEGDAMPGSIALFGSFDWLPNQDALSWFVKSIFPLVVSQYGDARLTIVGKDIPGEVQELRGKGITIRGFVPDLRHELRKHLLTVVPLRMGGGMRLKIVESFAMQIPVVSTSIGCEGIECRDGEHLLIADTEKEFAGQVVRMLTDRRLREKLSRSAWTLARERYRWETAAESLETVYREAIGRRMDNGNKGDVA